MPDRLDAIKLKIGRAKDHVRDLESVVVPFFDSFPYTYAADILPQISQYAIRLATVKPLPHCIPIIAGDAVHNLRSALDHVAWQLVEAGGGNPNDRTSFPIIAADAKARQRYASAVGQGNIAKMKSGALSLLESVQPYNSGDDTLAAIHQLDIWDKHRLIVAVHATLGAWGLKTPQLWFDDLGFGKPIEVGDEICRIPQSTWEESHENIRFDFYSAFGGPGIVRGKSVLEMLNKMADVVTLTVGSFEEFLL
jgi:hypothetical protein